MTKSFSIYRYLSPPTHGSGQDALADLGNPELIIKFPLLLLLAGAGLVQ